MTQEAPQYVADEAMLNAGRSAMEVSEEIMEFMETHVANITWSDSNALVAFCVWQQTRAIERQTIALNRQARAQEGLLDLLQGVRDNGLYVNRA